MRKVQNLTAQEVLGHISQGSLNKIRDIYVIPDINTIIEVASLPLWKVINYSNDPDIIFIKITKEEQE